MPIFDDLGRDFTAWRDAYFDDQRRSWAFMGRFRDLYREYIGATGTYRNGFDDSAEVIPYVSLASVTYDTETNLYNYRRQNNPADALTSWEDNRWHFGLITALEVSRTTYPKQSFWVPCAFVLDGNSCRFQIFEREEGRFIIDIADDANFIPAFDFIIGWLRRMLAQRRIDLVEAPRQYGFSTFPAPQN